MSNQKYIRAKALVVGIDHYEQANQLDNAVNDAKAIANILRQLKFYVCDFYDIDIDKWDEVFSEFAKTWTNMMLVPFILLDMVLR